MSNNHTSIHDFDFTLICNYFKSLERQGPGSPEATQKALSFINELSEKSQIADIGCGTGGQTIHTGRVHQRTNHRHRPFPGLY